MTTIIAAVAGFALGGAIAFVLFRRGNNDEALKELEQEALKAAENARIEFKENEEKQVEEITKRIEDELRETRDELNQQKDRLERNEKDVEDRNQQLRRQEKGINRREKDLARREKKLTQKERHLDEMVGFQKEQVESLAGLSRSEAKNLLIEEVREEAMRSSIERIRTIEQEAMALAEDRARMVVSAAIQRYASEYVAERTVAAVTLAKEEMKGRIIGREGRNIRAFESASGCDVVIDESPDTVMVSSFNPVRREVGRLAMEKLLADGRIHPSRIEEVVGRTRKEVEQVMKQKGEQAALEVEVTGLHPKLITTLGRLHFVSTFGQNALRHSVEVAHLSGLIADELGLQRKQAVRAGLLHDIGKALDHEAEGSSASVGAALCRKHGESKAIVATVANLPSPEKQRTSLEQIVSAANTLSESRPGAKRDSLASHVKRLDELEDAISDMDGVERCYAIKAGSEVRVMVDNARMSDRDADLLSREISRRIEREMSYAEDIKVSVIRSVRAVNYAR